jgi:3-deoxy-D-manno-octulosonate 8-phosphate phosphatase (KDO 8-P phosphatase)
MDMQTKKQISGRIEKIKVLFSDIDGTLTDGRLYYGEQGEVLKVFNVKDGAGIKQWISAGFEFGVISARSSKIISVRMNELGVKHIITGVEDKKFALDTWLKQNNFTWENLAYIGDDLNDLAVLTCSGISAAPLNAVRSVFNQAQYQCVNAGGAAALREFIDFLLDSIPAT